MKKSFTLIETIITIFIFFVLMLAVSEIILILYKTYSYSFQQAMAVSEAKRGIETMVKEIRSAREGENGAYPIEYAGDKEFIFYSDIDHDGRIERVRYFLGEIESTILTKECQSSLKGGSCTVSFSNFLKGTLKSATVKISVDGDLGASTEYVDIYLDNQYLGRLCQSGCKDCVKGWQGTQTFNILNFAQDNSLSFAAFASSQVDPSCPYSIKVQFEVSLTQEIQGTQLKKGVIKPVGSPATYPLDEEMVSVISSYVRNSPPIFEYFDEKNNKIEDTPARLKNTKVMKVFLVINVDPNKPPTEYQLQSFVNLRNLKKE